jgi:cell division GTPase FtsZ
MTLPTALTDPTPDIEDVARTSGIPTAEIVATPVSEEVEPYM